MQRVRHAMEGEGHPRGLRPRTTRAGNKGYHIISYHIIARAIHIISNLLLLPHTIRHIYIQRTVPVQTTCLVGTEYLKNLKHLVLYSVFGTWYSVFGTWYWVLGTGYWVLGTGCSTTAIALTSSHLSFSPFSSDLFIFYSVCVCVYV